MSKISSYEVGASSGSSTPKAAETGVTIETVDPLASTASLGHMPNERFSPKRFVKSLASKEAWLGDYDYAALFIPTIPYLTKKRSLPFFGVNDQLPYLLVIILGLQHCLAMAGGLVTPPLLLAGVAGANLDSATQSYLVSACLIWSGIATVVQLSRWRLGKTKYYLGTGIISVCGTSFSFAGVALNYFAQSYANGTCPMAADGVTKLPCPVEYGAVLGTCTLTGIFAIGLAFLPPKVIGKMFPPLVTGLMLTLIGASLISAGVTNWAGGSGLCKSDHTLLCTTGSQSHPWGSAPYVGLGFSCFITIVLCEIFGSAFMKSASVFIGLVTGMIIAAATGYFDGSAIAAAPSGTFLWTHTFKLGVRGQLVLPMLAVWCVSIAETIGNVSAGCDVSQLEISGEKFQTRVQGGILADALSATLAGLATISPSTTFAQNSGVIALTRNASRQSGYMCAFFLVICGIAGKVGAIFVAAPPSVIGGFTTFLFGSVTASGLRILAYAPWTRRDRFIVTAAGALGLAALSVPDWFSYVFTYSGTNQGLAGLIQAIVLIVEEPYLISAFVAAFLNAVLPADVDAQLAAEAKENAEKEVLQMQQA